MDIVIGEYDAGYGGRSIMINHTFYPIGKINRNITKIIGCCESGRYAGLYMELLNTLDILEIPKDQGNYYTITIVDNAYISRIYYYDTFKRKGDHPTKFDVIKPDFSMIFEDFLFQKISEAKDNGRS